MFASLLDLMLPAACPGCRMVAAVGLCPGCAEELHAASPRAVRPDPPPDGLPPCYGVGWYEGLLREVILGYKERGRYGLAPALAERLAAAVFAAAPGRRPVVLIPVPATARAVRRRRGDHMVRLTRGVAERHRRSGRTAVVLKALRAAPRPDSAGLNAAQRAAVARTALRPRSGVAKALRRIVVPATADGASSSAVPAVVVLDDVLTTGATLTAACEALTSTGVQVTAAAVLAATERRR